MAPVTLKKLVKRYGNVDVVHGIDLEVKDREFIALVGPSGCGKSTLLRIIAGLEDTTSGRVLIDGRDVTATPPANRGIAMVFQSYALYPHLNVRNNMSLGLKQIGTPSAEIERRVAEASKMLSLEPYLGRRPAELSGGQRQRVAIGRAVVREPKLFLFDEPLSNLDAALRVNTRLEIAQLHRRLKSTMIYVTHDQVEAMTLADRIAVMRGGIIQQLDTPQAIYSRPVNRFVAGFIGSPSMNFVDGRIEKGGSGPVFVAGELEIPLLTYAFKDGPVTASEATLGVRPEHIGLNSGAGWPFEKRVKVEVVEPMGSDTLVWTKLGGHDFSMRVASERAPEVGDDVAIGFDPMRASLFDAGGIRI